MPIKKISRSRLQGTPLAAAHAGNVPDKIDEIISGHNGLESDHELLTSSHNDLSAAHQALVLEHSGLVDLHGSMQTSFDYLVDQVDTGSSANTGVLESIDVSGFYDSRIPGNHDGYAFTPLLSDIPVEGALVYVEVDVMVMGDQNVTSGWSWCSQRMIWRYFGGELKWRRVQTPNGSQGAAQGPYIFLSSTEDVVDNPNGDRYRYTQAVATEHSLENSQLYFAFGYGQTLTRWHATGEVRHRFMSPPVDP